MKTIRKPIPKVVKAAVPFLLVFGVASIGLFSFMGQTDPEDIPPSPAETIIETTPTIETVPLEAEPAIVKSVVGIFETDRLPREIYPAAENDMFSELSFPFYLPEEYSLREKTTTVLTRQKGENDSQDYAILSAQTAPRLAVETYMGYILFDDGEYILLCTEDGAPLFKYSPDDYEPAYERDRDGNPLFVHYIDEQHKIYYTASTTGFEENGYNPSADSRKLKFDYPADYGKGSEYTVVTSGKERGALYGVNKSGEPLFSPHTTYYNEHRRYVDEYYLPPLTDGIESIGFYYFDHGYTRVRRQIIDHYNYFGLGQIKVVSDEDILVSKSGRVFPLPDGYRLAGYSEGMLLLERGGKYGFVNLTGEWIAQPIFTSATPFMSGYSTLTTEDGRVGMIDIDGNIILPFAYKSISLCSAGIIAVYSETYGWEIIKITNN